MEAERVEWESCFCDLDLSKRFVSTLISKHYVSCLKFSELHWNSILGRHGWIHEWINKYIEGIVPGVLDFVDMYVWMYDIRNNSCFVRSLLLVRVLGSESWCKSN